MRPAPQPRPAAGTGRRSRTPDPALPASPVACLGIPWPTLFHASQRRSSGHLKSPTPLITSDSIYAP